MNSKVMEIDQITLRGNVTDDGWFHNLKTDAGKPHMLAIMILSDVVYWYRPVTYRDELTQQTIFKQKFHADKLQRSYQQFADRFGVSKVQAKRACDFLKQKRLIEVEFRTIGVNGSALTNVMFVEPVPEEIKKVSTSYQESEDLLTKKLGGYDEIVKTYTDTSSNTSTDINNIDKQQDNYSNDDEIINLHDLVAMKRKEYNKLIEEFGKELTGEMIEKLNNYKGSTGKKYKSDYYTVRNWIAKDKKKLTPKVNISSHDKQNYFNEELSASIDFDIDVSPF